MKKKFKCFFLIIYTYCFLSFTPQSWFTLKNWFKPENQFMLENHFTLISEILVHA